MQIEPGARGVENGKGGKQAYVLARARDAPSGDRAGFETCDWCVLKTDCAAGRAINARDDVEYSRFTGAVRANQADQIVRADLQIECRNGGESTKANGALLEIEKWRVHVDLTRISRQFCAFARAADWNSSPR